jgi:hypothetical protein
LAATRRPAFLVAAFAIVVLIFYSTPLFDRAASIQWDAADVHYTAQKYLADSLHRFHLPFWTPDLFSGMPFLADPQTGAWYPLNWPFFLLGIGPRSIEWELALHCFLACLGAFLLARDLLGSTVPALFAAAFYGFSGFFAGHSSHVGMFQTAALLPWLLWTTGRAIHSADRLRWILAAGLTGACVILAGHFQSALYSFIALSLFVTAGEIARRGQTIKTAALAMATILAISVLGSAVAWMPGLELTRQSIRAGADYSGETNGALVPGALATLMIPDYYGAQRGPYHGPQDITQFYFYGGFLLLPLAIAGSLVARVRWYAVALIGPCLWYAFGPAGGLYLLLARLPGLRSVRAPVHIWFVVALGLALLAAAGVQTLRTHFPQTAVVAALLVVVCGDLWHANMDSNALAYGRFLFDARYGIQYEQVRDAVAPFAHGLYRFWSPGGVGAFNSSLVYPMEVTFGYNPLELSRYDAYLRAAASNEKLLNGLSVTVKLDVSGHLVANAEALPRATFPGQVRRAANPGEAESAIAKLDPALETIVEGLPRHIAQDHNAVAQVVNYDQGRYRVHYRSQSEGLLRMAIPYFPGWKASADGRDLPVVPADEALLGVVTPAGEHEVDITYHSNWFGIALGVSGTVWLGSLALLMQRRAASGISGTGIHHHQ